MTIHKTLSGFILAGSVCFACATLAQIDSIKGGLGSAPRLRGSPISYLSGAPYSATTKLSKTRTLADGTTSVCVEVGIYARDSAGRNYYQTKTVETSKDIVPEQLISTTVEDPVGHTIAKWNNREKWITVRALRESAEVLGDETSKQPLVSSSLTSGARTIKQESLGKQTISGVDAIGTRITDTTPSGTSGNDQPVIRIYESWVAVDLRVLVRTTSLEPGLSSHLELTDIHRGAPDLSPFKAPDGYTVQQYRPSD